MILRKKKKFSNLKRNTHTRETGTAGVDKTKSIFALSSKCGSGSFQLYSD
jgi:hypothetical protein